MLGKGLHFPNFTHYANHSNLSESFVKLNFTLEKVKIHLGMNKFKKASKFCHKKGIFTDFFHR